jgi:CRISPR-associated protein Cas2
MRGDILLCYDVNTEDREGRRRLARVAKICKDFGQRVQHSVFECTVSEVDMEKLRNKLRSVIAADKDSLRIYHLKSLRTEYVEAYGRNEYIDFSDDTLIA